MLDRLLSEAVPVITVNEFNKKSDRVFILDVREKREFDVSRIKGAVFAVTNDQNRLISIPEGLSKSESIVVYCSVGYRSEQITQQLIDEGYENTVNLYGGIFEWVNQGFALYNDSGRTDEIHAYGLFWGLWVKSENKVYK